MKSRANIVLILLVILVSAVISRYQASAGRRTDLGVYSAWSIKSGMTTEEVSEHLPEAPPIETGVIFYCEACDPSSWATQQCRQHFVGADSSEKSPEQGVVNFHEGRVSSLTSPFLQRDGGKIFGEGDPLELVLETLEGESVVRHDSWNTTVTIDSEGLVVVLHGDKVTNIHLNRPRQGGEASAANLDL